MGEREFSRSERVADQIQRAIAEIVAREVNDPRLERITISSVDLSKDLKNAKAYFSVPADVDKDEVLRSLKHAASFVRKRLATRVRLKFLPKVSFAYDSALDRAHRVSALLDSVKPRDGYPDDDPDAKD